MSDAAILRRHRLAHIPELKVGENVLTIRYKSGCAMTRCSGKCCREGVVIGLAERDRVLKHAELVQSLMDASQDPDPRHWFDEEFADNDAVEGRSSGTRVHNDKCVFLNKDARCVLQTASEAAGASLKPFYCYAYPICVTEGELVIDDVHCPEETQCCGPAAEGELSILDLCQWELEYVLGRDGLEELKDLFATKAALAKPRRK